MAVNTIDKLQFLSFLNSQQQTVVERHIDTLYDRRAYSRRQRLGAEL